MERVIQKIRKEQFGDEEIERKDFDAGAGEIPQAIEELLSLSLFSSNKIVVIKRIKKPARAKSAQSTTNSRKKKTDPFSSLADFINKPRGSTPLIMFCEAKSDIPKPIETALGKKRIAELKKTTPAEIRKAILRRCEQQNVTLKNNAFEYILECCGDNAEAAQRETQKLLLWAKEGQTVTIEDCRLLIQKEIEEDIWAVSNSVAAKDAEKALLALGQSIELGKAPQEIVGQLSKLFRDLLQCKALTTEKVPPSEWEKRTGMRGWGLDLKMRESKRFTIEALRDGVSRLQQADEDIKGNKLDINFALERAIMDLCGAAAKDSMS